MKKNPLLLLLWIFLFIFTIFNFIGAQNDPCSISQESELSDAIDTCETITLEDMVEVNNKYECLNNVSFVGNGSETGFSLNRYQGVLELGSQRSFNFSDMKIVIEQRSRHKDPKYHIRALEGSRLWFFNVEIFTWGFRCLKLHDRSEVVMARGSISNCFVSGAGKNVPPFLLLEYMTLDYIRADRGQDFTVELYHNVIRNGARFSPVTTSSVEENTVDGGLFIGGGSATVKNNHFEGSGSLWVSGSDLLNISNNHFEGSGSLGVSRSNSLNISNNHFEGCRKYCLQGHDNGLLNILNNTFENIIENGIESIQTEATYVEGNSFHGGEFQLQASGDSITIDQNSFYGGEGQLQASGDSITIDQNSFYGGEGQLGASGDSITITRNKMYYANLDPLSLLSLKEIQVYENVILSESNSATIRKRSSPPPQRVLYSNSIKLHIKDNCILGTSLEIPELPREKIKISDNWWGQQTGPTDTQLQTPPNYDISCSPRRIPLPNCLSGLHVKVKDPLPWYKDGDYIHSEIACDNNAINCDNLTLTIGFSEEEDPTESFIPVEISPNKSAPFSFVVTQDFPLHKWYYLRVESSNLTAYSLEFEIDPIKNISIVSPLPSPVLKGDPLTVSWEISGIIEDVAVAITDVLDGSTVLNSSIVKNNTFYTFDEITLESDRHFGPYYQVLIFSVNYPQIISQSELTIKTKPFNNIMIDLNTLEYEQYTYSGHDIVVSWDHVQNPATEINIEMVNEKRSITIASNISSTLNQNNIQNITVPSLANSEFGFYFIRMTSFEGIPETSDQYYEFDVGEKMVEVMIDTESNAGNWYEQNTEIEITWEIVSGHLGSRFNLDLMINDSFSIPIEYNTTENSITLLLPEISTLNAFIRIVSQNYPFVKNYSSTFEIDEPKLFSFGQMSPELSLYPMNKMITFNWTYSGYIGSLIYFYLSHYDEVDDEFYQEELPESPFSISDVGRWRLNLPDGFYPDANYSIVLEASGNLKYLNESLIAESQRFSIEGDTSISSVTIDFNGKEYLVPGDQLTVKWISGDYSGTDVTISIIDNGDHVYIIDSSVNNNEGSSNNTFVLKIPSSEKLQGHRYEYAVQVKSNYFEDSFDESDLMEIDMETKRIKCVSPRHNEFWETGKKENITWNSTGVIGLINISLISINGSNVIIGENVPNEFGNYEWEVQLENNQQTGWYYFSIVATEYSDISVDSEIFEINEPPFIELISPIESDILEYFVIDDAVDVEWRSVGRISHVEIDLLLNDKFFSRIDNVTNEQETNNMYEWHINDVPLDALPSNNFQIRLTGNHLGEAIDETSDMFEIVAFVKRIFHIQVPSSITTGNNITISWNVAGDCGLVDIELVSRDNENDGFIIGENIPANHAQYEWPVDLFDEMEGNYTIQISSSSYGSIEAESEPFYLRQYRALHFGSIFPDRGYFLPNDSYEITEFTNTEIEKVDVILKKNDSMADESILLNRVDLKKRDDITFKIPLKEDLEPGEYYITVRGGEYHNIKEDSNVFEIDVEVKTLNIFRVESSFDFGNNISVFWNNTGTIDSINIRLENNSSTIPNSIQEFDNLGFAQYRIPSNLQVGEYNLTIHSNQYQDVQYSKLIVLGENEEKSIFESSSFPGSEYSDSWSSDQSETLLSSDSLPSSQNESTSKEESDSGSITSTSSEENSISHFESESEIESESKKLLSSDSDSFYPDSELSSQENLASGSESITISSSSLLESLSDSYQDKEVSSEEERSSLDSISNDDSSLVSESSSSSQEESNSSLDEFSSKSSEWSSPIDDSNFDSHSDLSSSSDSHSKLSSESPSQSESHFSSSSKSDSESTQSESTPLDSESEFTPHSKSWSSSSSSDSSSYSSSSDSILNSQFSSETESSISLTSEGFLSESSSQSESTLDSQSLSDSESYWHSTSESEQNSFSSENSSKIPFSESESENNPVESSSSIESDSETEIQSDSSETESSSDSMHDSSSNSEPQTTSKSESNSESGSYFYSQSISDTEESISSSAIDSKFSSESSSNSGSKELDSNDNSSTFNQDSESTSDTLTSDSSQKSRSENEMNSDEELSESNSLSESKEKSSSESDFNSFMESISQLSDFSQSDEDSKSSSFSEDGYNSNNEDETISTSSTSQNTSTEEDHSSLGSNQDSTTSQSTIDNNSEKSSESEIDSSSSSSSGSSDSENSSFSYSFGDGSKSESSSNTESISESQSSISSHRSSEYSEASSSRSSLSQDSNSENTSSSDDLSSISVSEEVSESSSTVSSISHSNYNLDSDSQFQSDEQQDSESNSNTSSQKSESLSNSLRESSSGNSFSDSTVFDSRDDLSSSSGSLEESLSSFNDADSTESYSSQLKSSSQSESSSSSENNEFSSDFSSISSSDTKSSSSYSLSSEEDELNSFDSHSNMYSSEISSSILSSSSEYSSSSSPEHSSSLSSKYSSSSSSSLSSSSEYSSSSSPEHSSSLSSKYSSSSSSSLSSSSEYSSSLSSSLSFKSSSHDKTSNSESLSGFEPMSSSQDETIVSGEEDEDSIFPSLSADSSSESSGQDNTGSDKVTQKGQSGIDGAKVGSILGGVLGGLVATGAVVAVGTMGGIYLVRYVRNLTPRISPSQFDDMQYDSIVP